MQRRDQREVAEQQVAVRLAHARQLHLRHDILEDGLELERRELAARQRPPLAVQPLLLLQQPLLELEQPLPEAGIHALRIIGEPAALPGRSHLHLVGLLSRALEARPEAPDHLLRLHAAAVVGQPDRLLKLLQEGVHVVVGIPQRGPLQLRLHLDRAVLAAPVARALPV